ncbi:MAG: dihydrofolate reductase [SAR324 cluster bacterium]|nr:dihydrofolate reductase [SAR324 cluster bacterium]
MVSIICALAENGVIGNNNALPWHLPNDMKSFVRLTSGHTVLMGRKTFQSIKRPLPNRVNVVITRQKNYQIEGCIIAHSVEDAISHARDLGETEAFIIGGEQIYREAIKFSQKMYLTRLEESFAGDTYFPQYNAEEWREVEREEYKIDEKNTYPFSICTYERL